ncbi:hypothetical protein Tco_1326818 [Tanacetum coccineum]
MLKQHEEKRIEREQAANLAVQKEQEEQAARKRLSKAITPDLPTEEPDNSLSMGDDHLSIIPKTESDKLIKSNVENLFAGELDLIDPILSGIDEDDFDEEEGAIDIDILQIEDEILREKLLNVNLLIDKIEALNLTPSIPFVLEYPSSSPIPVVDSDFLIEEVDTFLVLEDSIPPGIKSDFDLEGDIIFLDDLLNDDPIPEYERFTFDLRRYAVDKPILMSLWKTNDCPDFKDSRARGFVHHPIDLQSIACLYWESDIVNLID